MRKNDVPGRKIWMVAVPPLLYLLLAGLIWNMELNNWSNSGDGLDAVSTPIADFCFAMVLISLIFAIIALPIADQAALKGKGWSSFFWLSILLSPLITWLIVSSINKEDRPSNSATKVCPKCAEDVKSAAVICKHCGSRFSSKSN